MFGTRVEVAVYGEDPALAHTAMAAVLREFDRLHRQYHAWEPSELTRLNAAIAAGEPFRVSDELQALLLTAQAVAVKSDGLFDPALGKLIQLWGFHTDTFLSRLPDPDAVQAVLATRPRMEDLTIAGNEVHSINRNVQLDFGGYVKGYALDRAAAILREHQITSALVNIGGNVIALGQKGAQPWRIGIQHPREPGILASLPLYDGEAVGTSGDYQRYFEVDGVRYAHLLDPRTGRPAQGTVSLTVLVTAQPRSGMLSDVLSKPAYIAGEHWQEQTRRFDVKHALRVADDGRIEVTRALRARLKLASDVTVTTVED